MIFHPYRWLFYAVLVNSALAALLVMTLVPAESWLASWQTTAFMPFALVSHFFFIFLPAYLLLYLLCRFLFSTDRQVLVAAIVLTLLLSLVVIDVKLFSLYRFHLNGMVLNLIMGGAALQILSLSAIMYVIAAIGLVAVFLGQWVLCKWLKSKSPQYRSKAVLLVVPVLAVMLSTQLFYALSDAKGDKTVTRLVRYIPWALPLTAKRQLKNWGVEVVEQPASLNRIKRSGLNYPLRPVECNTESSGMNLLMVVIESLRSDMMTPQIMPNSSVLAERGVRFNQHFSTGNSTRFGLFGLLYGLPGSYWHPMLGEQRSSVLVDTLVARNYQLFIDGAASLSSPEFDRTAFSEVTDQLVSGRELKKQAGNADFHIDELVARDLRERIRNREPDRPFFGFVFFDGPHNFTAGKAAENLFQPAWDSVNYLELGPDTDITGFVNLYRNSVHYTDALIGQLLQMLDAEDLSKDTVVIITADHAKEFNDSGNNYWGHNSSFTRYQTQVPMLLYVPGKQAGTINHRTSHEDVVPTLMQHLLGCSDDSAIYSTGQDLLAPDYESRDLLLESWSRRALMTSDAYYVFESSGGFDKRDPDYQLSVDQEMSPQLGLEAMQQMRKFLN